MTGSLLALLDDIASLLDDIASMSKVAAKKTAGLLGDDLALNAQQVTGVRADRELPVVFAVAIGSLKNKLILIPAALLISAILPALITPMLMLGGAYLCFEGFEKVAHRFLHSESERQAHHDAELNAVKDSKTDLVKFEKQKIRGAIRTDFILSSEIIVITLGLVAEASLVTQLVVLTLTGLLMTVCVYGFVGAIVKLDDAGLYLIQRPGALLQKLGGILLSAAPLLMKSLSVVGTLAMFLVGGGILMHGFHDLQSGVQNLSQSLGDIAHLGSLLEMLTPLLIDMLFGLVAGGVVFGVVMVVLKLKKRM